MNKLYQWDACTGTKGKLTPEFSSAKKKTVQIKLRKDEEFDGRRKLQLPYTTETSTSFQTKSDTTVGDS